MTKKSVGVFSARVIRELRQTGSRKSIVRDRSRDAILPGKRISKRGNVYWETRKNRSDAIGQKI